MATETVDALALQAFDLAKNSLLVRLRFMNAAFARLKPLAIPKATLATDGAHIRFDPASFAQHYAAEPAFATRAFLHMTLHNVFLHLYMDEHIDALRWDTACDIAVEHVIAQLDLPAARTEQSTRQLATLAEIEANLNIVTAETIYKYLLETYADNETVEAMREPFAVDDHAPWHTMAAEEAKRREQEKSKRVEENDTKRTDAATQAAQDGTDVDLPDDADKREKSHASRRGMKQEDIVQKEAPENAAEAIGKRFANTVNLDRSREQWKNAAYEMGVQLDTYVQLWGVEGSNLAMNLRSVTREKQDYREFLRKFARMGEHMRINDDEFDYVYYCYGLSRYGNLPLIEPLEYSEEKRIRDFVVAIDTSASTKDGLVRKFIEKTYSILANETSFFTDMNVLIIQCDAEIADVTRISSLADMNRYLDDLEIKGLGGTDFRPVFSYVDAALERGEFSDLAGIIYFTDGQGTYPARKPDYEAAFVFVDDDAGVTVPIWAMKVVLEEKALIE
ncbi:MAG: VWA-like domain-containing protein [Slackia sp.]|nr:VWA-like domain-containing protein [Slackia sp.]